MAGDLDDGDVVIVIYAQERGVHQVGFVVEGWNLASQYLEGLAPYCFGIEGLGAGGGFSVACVVADGYGFLIYLIHSLTLADRAVVAELAFLLLAFGFLLLCLFAMEGVGKLPVAS